MKDKKTSHQQHYRVSKIFAIKENMVMYEDKMRVERERDLSTDLLAVAGIEEPKIFKIKTVMILKTYLALCSVTHH